MTQRTAPHLLNGDCVEAIAEVQEIIAVRNPKPPRWEKRRSERAEARKADRRGNRRAEAEEPVQPPPVAAMAAPTPIATNDNTAVSAKSLDKYYTNDDVARLCWRAFKPCIPTDAILIEPSAGGGAFMRAVDREIIGFDIAPEANGIIQADFLDLDVFEHVEEGAKLAVIGNFPYGHRNRLTIDFLNRSLSFADYVGCIVPAGFQKFNYQQRVDPEARLVMSLELPEQSFHFEGKPYKINTVFQVWTKAHLRNVVRLPTTHVDFDIHSANTAERAAELFHGVAWDMAIPRIGLRSIEKVVYGRSDPHADPSKQYHFIKVTKPEALARLKRVDWMTLAFKGMSSVPTLSRANLIEAYEAVKASEPPEIIEHTSMCAIRRPRPEKFQWAA
jgi:hypothetical protein